MLETLTKIILDTKNLDRSPDRCLTLNQNFRMVKKKLKSKNNILISLATQLADTSWDCSTIEWTSTIALI